MTPMSTVVAPLDNTETSDILECTPEQTEHRLNVCKLCENFTIRDTTTCSATGCNISLMITYSFKQCPLGKW
jgi:hypothetical protein